MCCIVCNRPKLINQDYCIFHKPNKNQLEIETFWLLLNSFSWALIWSASNERTHPSHIKFRVLIRNTLSYKHRKLFGLGKIAIQNILYSLQETYPPPFFEANFSNFVFPLLTYNGGREFETFKCIQTPQPIKYSFNNICLDKSWLEFKDYNFNGECFFDNIQGENRHPIRFNNVCFEDIVIFKNIKENVPLEFNNVKFNGRKVFFENIENLNFNNVEFAFETEIILNNLKYSSAEYGIVASKVYRYAKIQAMQIGDYSTAGDYYYNEREFKRKLLPKSKNYNCLNHFIEYMIAITTGYGEKLDRIILSSIVFIVFSSLLFYIANPKNAWNSIFFSFITFTTLGAKTPTDLTGVTLNLYEKAILCFESFIGSLFLALIVLTLSKKCSR